MWVYTPGRILAVDDHLVRFRGILEGGHLTNHHCGVGSTPIILSWHVTMSTDRFPHESLTMWLTNRVDPTTGMGACSSVSSGEVQGNWLLHRVLAISTNPGRGTHGQTMAPSIKASTLGLEVASGLELQVVKVEHLVAQGTESLASPLCWFSSAQR